MIRNALSFPVLINEIIMFCRVHQDKNTDLLCFCELVSLLITLFRRTFVAQDR